MAVSSPRMTKGNVRRIGHAGMAFTPPHEKDGQRKDVECGMAM
jgi:hypothetical protein